MKIPAVVILLTHGIKNEASTTVPPPSPPRNKNIISHKFRKISSRKTKIYF